jgi:hypothetical protein
MPIRKPSPPVRDQPRPASSPRVTAAPPIIVEARAKFRELTESEVIAELETKNPTNPIHAEVQRLCNAYAEVYVEEMMRARRNPRLAFSPIEATCAIEAVAKRVAADMIAAQLNARASPEGTA